MIVHAESVHCWITVAQGEAGPPAQRAANPNLIEALGFE